MDQKRSILLARKDIAGKIKNCRTLMRRNDPERSTSSLNLMAKLAAEAEGASSSQSLLGIEGAAAECYFSRFANLLKEGSGSLTRAIPKVRVTQSN